MATATTSSYLSLDKNELVDIFNHSAFSSFVDKHMQGAFEYEFVQDNSSSSDEHDPLINFSWPILTEDFESSFSIPPIFDSESLIVWSPPVSPPVSSSPLELSSSTANDVFEMSPAPLPLPPMEVPKGKEKARRSPIHKKYELPKQSTTFTKIRRTSTNKLIWTKALQQRFLGALEILGTHSAMPSDVLYIMNVKGLTRGNVASHLQKYRQRLMKQQNNIYDDSDDDEIVDDDA